MPSPDLPPQTGVPTETRALQPSESALAVADLAGKLGVAADTIIIRSVERVQWRDSSLGCARPGRMYAQVITPGCRIVLEAGGRSYEYHTGDGRVMACTP